MKAAEKKLAAAALLALSAVLHSCADKDKGEIALDNSDPLALAPDVRWALIVEPYAAFREEKSWDAETTDYCKQGEFFPVLATSITQSESGAENWYRFEEGWLPESALSLYSNKLKAQKAAADLRAKK